MQYADTPGFYQDFQYDRALDWLEWMTKTIHQNDKFRNVGMVELVNEPVQDAGQVSSMRTSYYPDAFKVGHLHLTVEEPRAKQPAHPRHRNFPLRPLRQLPARPDDEREMGLRRSH